jgi:uncharacterized protein (DUF1697 family)
MDALKKMYMDLGFVNTHTYIQSGNVVFQTEKSKPCQLEQKIKDVILKVCGFDVPVIIKDSKELKVVLLSNPFIKKKDIDITKLHVTFLSQIPEQSFVNNLKEVNFPHDQFILTKDTVYLFCPSGYGDTKLSNNFFENKLKVTATTRNWKTVNELNKIAESII